MNHNAENIYNTAGRDSEIKQALIDSGIAIGGNGLSISGYRGLSIGQGQGGDDFGVYDHKGNYIAGFGNGRLSEKTEVFVRGTLLGFDSVAVIAAGATTRLTSRPQRAFRPERLVFSGATSQSLNVNLIVVGNDNQVASQDSFPADAFDPDAWGVRLRMDTADPALDVAIEVNNISGGDVRARALMTGTGVLAKGA